MICTGCDEVEFTKGVTIESTPSGKLIPDWLDKAIIEDLANNIVIIHPSESARQDYLSHISSKKPSLDSSKHLTIKRLVRALLTDYRQPKVLDDDSILLGLVHHECIIRAKKGRFPFIHRQENAWSLTKTQRLQKLHKELTCLPNLPTWDTDPGVEEFRKVLQRIEDKSAGIHPDLMNIRLHQLLINQEGGSLPFTFKGVDGILLLNQPPEFTSIEREIFNCLAEIIPVHQLSNPGRFRLGYGGAYLKDITWCKQSEIPAWVPPHALCDESNGASWLSTVGESRQSDYHQVMVERAEHIVDATFNLLDEIELIQNQKIIIVDAAIEARRNNWEERLSARGILGNPAESAIGEVPIIQELVYHLSLCSGLEAWSFERIRRLANSANLTIQFDNEVTHPENPLIKPRPHVDLLEKISRSFHVLGGPGAAERWLQTLANKMQQIGDFDDQASVKQEETQWWLANVIRLCSPLIDNEITTENLIGCHSGLKLPLISKPETGLAMLESLIKCINWEYLMLDDKQFNRCINAVNTLTATCFELQSLTNDSKKAKLKFVDIINMIIAKEQNPKPRIECENIKILAPSEAFGQTADIMILAGLDSESWSMKPNNVPWLDSLTKVKLGLSNSDIKIRQARHQLRHLLNSCNSMIIIDTSLDEAATPSPPLAEWLDDVSGNDEIFRQPPKFIASSSYSPGNNQRSWDLIESKGKKALKLRLFSTEVLDGVQYGTKSGTRGRDIRQRSGLSLRAGIIPEKLPNNKNALAMSMELPINTERHNNQATIKSVEKGEALPWSSRDGMISYSKLNLQPGRKSAESNTRGVSTWPNLGVRINGNITSPTIDPRPLPMQHELSPTIQSVMGYTGEIIAPKRWSPYRLQSWLKCPRQAWLVDFLKLPTTEVQDEDIDNRTRGLLMHDIEAEILSKIGTPILEQPLEHSSPLYLSKLSDEESLWEVALEYIKTESPWLNRKNAVSVHRCRELIGVGPEQLQQYIEGEIELEPGGKVHSYLQASLALNQSAALICEWRIGTDKGHQLSIEGQTDSGKNQSFVLSGRVDRVDELYLPDKASEGRLIIIRDMKTIAGPKFNNRGDRHRRAIFDELQLALYAKAWETAYPKDRVIGVGITEVGEDTQYYVELDTDFIGLVGEESIGNITTYTSNTYRDKQEQSAGKSNGFRAWLDERLTTAIRVINGANSGQANPTISNNCNYCKVRRMCPTSALEAEP